MTVAYDGTSYVGWQLQPNGVSIQECLEGAWYNVTQERSRIVASGRTDAGVHALGQVCSIATQTTRPCGVLQRALNAHTPEDISILEVMLAPQGFHAIRDASRKTYRYQIQYGRSRHPLKRNDHWYCPLTLDVPSMQRAASMLVGEHDFASFQAVGAERDSTVRLVTRLECKPIGDQRFPALWFEITCNGFLYNMVRIIVGTLVQVGQGSRPVEWVAEVLAGRDRTAAGPTAPAHGLVLLSVEYDQLQFLAEPE